MSTPIDRAYYEKRIREEKECAARASDWAAAAIHRELAGLYEDLLAEDDRASERRATRLR